MVIAAGVLVTAVALATELAVGGFADGHPVVPIVVALVVLLGAGFVAPLGVALAVAALGAAGRVLLDPAVETAPDAVLTFVAAALPVLVGRWARGQAQLRRELAAKGERLERERRRDAEQAAEEERMRIAGDLQAAAAGNLEAIARETRRAAVLIEAGDTATARDALEWVAATARQALDDVRRVLGILRREPAEPAAPSEPAPAPAPTGWAIPVWALPAALLAGAALEELLRFGAAGPSVLLAASLLLRVRLPLVAAAGVIAGVALQSALFDPASMPATSIVAIVCASYSLGAYAPGVAGAAGLAVFAVAVAAHAILVHPDAVPQALIGGTLIPWIVGRIRRGQRQLLREAEEKAAQADRDRERAARAAVTAERMRVARELHDAVAHNISVIAIQAAGAHGIVERDPARAATVVELVEAVTEEALLELGRLADEHDLQPGLAGVQALAERARAAGLPVELEIAGDPVPLPAGVDLAAFRIVQEALANASKHAGPARARVTVRYAPRAVELEIDDDGRGPNGGRAGGHGLVGMRERVALYGGTLEAGRRLSGGFAVRARLPL